MRRPVCCLALTAAVSCLAAGSALAAPAGPTHGRPSAQIRAHTAVTKRVVLTISAQIDGLSTLIIRGDRAVWFHQKEAAPGRHEGANSPTVIGGRSWYPKWPAAGENRDCGCRSKEEAVLSQPLPSKALIAFAAISCREACTGTAGNGKAEITFNDVEIGSDATYVVSLTYTVAVPLKKIPTKASAVISAVHAVNKVPGTEPEVFISRRGLGATQPLRSGADVQVGDVISTGPTTGAILDYAIGGRVQLFPGTTVEVTGERRVTARGPYTIDNFTCDLGRIWVGITTNAPRFENEIGTNGGVIGIHG